MGFARCQGKQQGKLIYFFRIFMAHFLSMKDKKPGFPGLRYRSGPGAPRRGCFASLQSLAPQGLSRFAHFNFS
jgi:hypothetical protein